MHDQFGLVLPKNQFEDWYQNDLATPLDFEVAIRCVATRGDLLCLTRGNVQALGSDFGAEVLNVLEVNVDDRALRGARFRSEDLKAAHDCLNHWWIEGLSPELKAIIAAGMRMSNLVEDGDVTSLSDLLDETFTLIDHRPMSFGQLDKAGSLAMWLDRASETPGLTVIAPRFYEVTPQGYVAEFESVLSGGFTSGGVALTTVKAGLITQAEFFEIYDLDQALARFDGLT